MNKTMKHASWPVRWLYSNICNNIQKLFSFAEDAHTTSCRSSVKPTQTIFPNFDDYDGYENDDDDDNRRVMQSNPNREVIPLEHVYNNYQDEKVKLYPELHRRILQAQLQRYRQHAITTTEQKRLT